MTKDINLSDIIMDNMKFVKNSQTSKRKLVFDKYGGKCAYCGTNLVLTKFDIDHINPKSLGGTNELKNLNPSCQRCNSWKKTFSIEEFREVIKSQVKKLRKDIAAFKLVEDYFMVKDCENEVKFYFEINNRGKHD